MLRQVVNESVQLLYPDKVRSLKALVLLSGDQVLSRDVENGYPAEFAFFGVDLNEL